MQNPPLTPKKAVKLTAKPELSDTRRICKVGDCGKKNKYVCTEIFI